MVRDQRGQYKSNVACFSAINFGRITMLPHERITVS